MRPDVFWYEAATQCGVGADILGLVAAQAVLMHYVEIRRWRDVTHPGTVDKDPLFNFSLAPHEVGYPGGIFAPFVPGNLDDLKKKEIKNGRLAMLGFVGFVMAAQVNGKGPLACLGDHIADPWTSTIYAKGMITPFFQSAPKCAIPDHMDFNDIAIPTPCFFEGLWP